MRSRGRLGVGGGVTVGRSGVVWDEGAVRIPGAGAGSEGGVGGVRGATTRGREHVVEAIAWVAGTSGRSCNFPNIPIVDS